jgi:hypothetical protein
MGQPGVIIAVYKFLGFSVAIAPPISLQCLGCGYIQSR